MKILVYGKGEFYRTHKNMLPRNAEIIAFVDSFMENTTVYRKMQFEGKDVIHVSGVTAIEFDYVYICTDFGYVWNILENLKRVGVSTKKIRMLYRECQKTNWEYTPTEDGLGYINSIGNICFEERTYTDFLSFEVLSDNEYGMPIKEEKFIVVDIGMNIGITSLYYAQKHECERVYGFEPFKDTYEKALHNFEMSSLLSQKIVPLNYALSDREYREIISVQNDESGQRSIVSEGISSVEKGYEIECRIAHDEITKIRNSSSLPLVLNIDTEGSEFAIMKDLDRNNGFERVIAIAMEWHADPKELFEILERNNFRYYFRDYGETGLVFALRDY